MLAIRTRSSRTRRGALTVLVLAIGLMLLGCAPPPPPPPAAAPTTVSLFEGRTPANPSEPDNSAAELGVRFRTSTGGSITGIRFFKSDRNTGTHQGTLWSNTGEPLATATFTNETASGWQSVQFNSPVPIAANTTYVASYHTDSGFYASDEGFFTAATTNGPLTAPVDGVNGRNSVYSYSKSSTFPRQSWGAANYWVDVTFNYDPNGAAPAPAVPAAPAPTTTTPVTTAAPTTTTTAPAPVVTVPQPPATNYPSASNTGVPSGVALTAYTGPSTITAPGTVIDSKLITDCLTIATDNVTITRSRIACAGDFGINQASGSGLLVQDTELTSASGSQLVDRAIQVYNNATIRRVYVHGTQRGVAIVGDNITIENSYVGQNSNATPAHTSAIGAWGNSDNVVLRHNTLRTELNTTASSSISIYPESGPNTNWTIDDNLLSSGGAYVLYAGYTPSAGEQPNTQIVFTNNKFNTDNYEWGGSAGAVASWSSPTNVWSNNTWYDLRPTTSAYTNKNGQLVTP